MASACYPARDMPHLTWCTTGQLSFLPVHAAGNYATESVVYNYVVSSYTPTLSALFSPAQPAASLSGILAVGQQFTLGLPSLPGTEAELACIKKQFQGHRMTQLDGDKATPAAVLAEMGNHSWVHLACYAIQNTDRLTESVFYLYGGRLS